MQGERGLGIIMGRKVEEKGAARIGHLRMQPEAHSTQAWPLATMCCH
jgi:hypothetical protein